MNITLPSRLTVNSFADLFIRTVRPDRTPVLESVIIDFSRLRFIEPTGVTVLSNLIEWLLFHSVDVNFTGHANQTEAVRFFDDSGFFERHLQRRLRPDSHCRITTKPLQFIETSYSYPWLHDDLMLWITQNSGRGVTAFRELLICLQEVFHNIRDHSGTKIGSVFAQFFPASHRLSISISDIGRGIPANVRGYLDDQERNINDANAIFKACTDGFTTASSPGNAGRGLAILTDNVTNYYKGTVIIISDKGFVQKRGGHQSTVLYERNWMYPGCLIDIEIKTDDIPDVDEAVEEFTW